MTYTSRIVRVTLEPGHTISIPVADADPKGVYPTEEDALAGAIRRLARTEPEWRCYYGDRLMDGSYLAASVDHYDCEGLDPEQVAAEMGERPEAIADIRRDAIEWLKDHNN